MSATVVFLFTDIEASTRRWEGNREAMAADLARHDELLMGVCTAWDGQVFSHTGDGLCAAFTTADAALGAAVAGQLALRSADWNRTRSLRVRMSVHAGAVESREGNYFGPTLNRTARLLATASGGQVVCSQAVADLAEDLCPTGITLVDLGEHRLADLARPERVFQVAHAELPADFPPLRSLEAQRHNLPVSLTSFVGRHDELGQVESLLHEARLVTLTGIGGAGKTRLALQAAAGLGKRFPDGTWLAELAPLRDPTLVAPVVVAALGLLPSGLVRVGELLENALCDHLRRRRLLLLLDNCEHLVESAARLVHAILARCPDVAVLATSRELLGVPGEVVYRVPPLSLPPPGPVGPEELAASDAVALFCERARAADAGFGLTEANFAAVSRICHRLDGIPLALELAAARIRVLGADQVAERLDQRFRFLGGGARTDDPRHRTLQAAIDWSHELLPLGEQVVLRRLAVFPGTFDLEAAEAVVTSVAGDRGPTGPGFDILEVLTRLVDKSLVVVSRQDAEVRYRLLETIRAYAAEKLADADEATLARQRHRDFFLALAEGWNQTAFDSWVLGPGLRRVEADLDNFRAALEWSLAQGDEESILRLAAPLWLYWMMSGRVEGFQWLERAVAVSDSTALRARVQALFGLAYLLRNLGGHSWERPRELSEEAINLALAADDRDALAFARLQLAEIALATGRPDEAELELRRALEVHASGGSSPGRGFCYHHLAWVALSRGEIVEAGEHLDRALEIARPSGDEFLMTHVLGALSLVSALLGEPERAERMGDEAVAAARRLPARQVLVMALSRAAEAAILSADHDRTARLLGELLRLLHELGSRRWVAEALELATIVLAETDPGAGAVVLGACEAVRTSLGEPASAGGILAEHVRKVRQQIADTLGAEPLENGLSEGRTMAVDEAIILALTRLETQWEARASERN